MVTPVTPTHPHGGPSGEHLKVPVGKAVDKISDLLTDLQDLGPIDTLPPAVQSLVALVGQLTTLLGTKSVEDLADIGGIIPALHKAMGSLESLVHQIRAETEKSDTIDFEKGPFATAWTNALLDKATTELTDLIQKIT